MNLSRYEASFLLLTLGMKLTLFLYVQGTASQSDLPKDKCMVDNMVLHSPVRCTTRDSSTTESTCGRRGREVTAAQQQIRHAADGANMRPAAAHRRRRRHMGYGIDVCTNLQRVYFFGQHIPPCIWYILHQQMEYILYKLSVYIIHRFASDNRGIYGCM